MISSSTLSGHTLRLGSFLPVTNLLAFIVAITAHVQNKIVIDPPEAPRGERAHAVGAHVAEGHE